MSCPRCGSNDIHNTQISLINQCNVCSRIFGEENSAKTDLDITEFMEKLCSYSSLNKVWFTLWKTGGAHRYTEILSYMDIARSNLSRALSQLLADGLLIKRDTKYQALSPMWIRGKFDGKKKV